jgi:hypothetical protein
MAEVRLVSPAEVRPLYVFMYLCKLVLYDYMTVTSF